MTSWPSQPWKTYYIMQGGYLNLIIVFWYWYWFLWPEFVIANINKIIWQHLRLLNWWDLCSVGDKRFQTDHSTIFVWKLQIFLETGFITEEYHFTKLTHIFCFISRRTLSRRLSRVCRIWHHDSSIWRTLQRKRSVLPGLFYYWPILLYHNFKFFIMHSS